MIGIMDRRLLYTLYRWDGKRGSRSAHSRSASRRLLTVFIGLMLIVDVSTPQRYNNRSMTYG